MNKTITQAIILAAGQGLRLRPTTENFPKYLIELRGNKSLLELSIEKISRMGIKNILIVVGHERDKIINRCSHIYGDLEIQYIQNREYLTSGTMESLASVCGLLEKNFLLLESDILYDYKIIEALMNSDHPNVIFAGKPFNMGDDVLISVDPNISHLVRDIGKSIGINTMDKESFIGISKISRTFAQSVIDEWFQKYKKINTYYSYEEVFVKVSNETAAYQDKLYMVSNHDLNWGEIDTHEDLEFISKVVGTFTLH
ncbi:MAG TPA: sugar phosphate nucleotidyltransferase [Syntrophales bacterium]|nr:sugar phosphate nucleotidyltransferase [Syntrophales bacterium]